MWAQRGSLTCPGTCGQEGGSQDLNSDLSLESGIAVPPALPSSVAGV